MIALSERTAKTAKATRISTRPTWCCSPLLPLPGVKSPATKPISPTPLSAILYFHKHPLEEAEEAEPATEPTDGSVSLPTAEA